MKITLTIARKGQVTLPQAALDHLGVKIGQRVDIELLPDGRVGLRLADARADVADLQGDLRRVGQRPLSLTEMQDSIEEAGER